MSDQTYHTRYTDEWVPLPEPLARQLKAAGWKEGTPLEIEAIEGVSNGKSTGFILLVRIPED